MNSGEEFFTTESFLLQSAQRARRDFFRISVISVVSYVKNLFTTESTERTEKTLGVLGDLCGELYQ